MKRFICRVLIVAFSCNALLPDAVLFAQQYSVQDYEELFLNDAESRPSPLHPEDPSFDYAMDTPWSMYASLPAQPPAPTYDELTGRPIDYDAQDDARRVKRGLYKGDAAVRQFLDNAPKTALVDWLAQNPLPRDSYQLGMNDYVPGLHLKHTTEKSSKAALKSLNKYYNNGELQFDDFITLLSAPANDVAAFAAYAINAILENILVSRDAENATVMLFFARDIQQSILKRLNALEKAPGTDPSVNPGHKLVQAMAPRQTESADSAELRSLLNLLLAKIRNLYRLAEDPDIRPVMREYERSFFQTYGGINYKDELSPSFYAAQQEKILNGLDYARTFRERVQGPSDSRLINVDFAAMTLITYDGVNGFRRLVDFLDRDNVNFNGAKQQSRLDQANFPFLQSAFDNLSLQYLEKLASREIPPAPKETTLLINTLIKYVNNGSAPTKVLALNLLTKIHEETSPKWTHGQGYDKGAAGGPALNAQTANQVADMIKDIYCRIDRSTRSVYGLDSNQMQEMATQLGKAYNRVRRDPQGFIKDADSPRVSMSVTHNGKRYFPKQILQKEGADDYRAASKWVWADSKNNVWKPLNAREIEAAEQERRWGGCYVRTGEEPRNQAVLAKEFSDGAMEFVLSWVAIGGAFRLIGKGASYTGSLVRLTNQARKMPAGQRMAFFRGTLQQAKAARKMAGELADLGVKVERMVPSSTGTKFTNAMTEIAPKGKTLGYKITQRLPGGQIKTTEVAGEVINRSAVRAGSKLPARITAQKGTLQSVTELAEKYVTKIPEGVSKQAYKEAVAVENIFKTGLEEISASNFQTGYGMNKIWLKDAQGKLYSQFEPIWVDLSNSAYMVRNSAGMPLTGKIRLDMLKAVTTPGGVMTGTASAAGKEGFAYLSNIAKVMATFAAADVVTMPITQALDGTYKAAPAGSPWYAEVGQYMNNVCDAIMHYDQAAANSLILPFSMVGKGFGWAWDKITRSGNATQEDFAKQLENNPYMKQYRQQTETLQKDFDAETHALVTLWKQSAANPDDLETAAKVDASIQNMQAKYANEQRGGLAGQWELIYTSLLIGQDPFAPSPYIDEYNY